MSLQGQPVEAATTRSACMARPRISVGPGCTTTLAGQGSATTAFACGVRGLPRRPLLLLRHLACLRHSGSAFVCHISNCEVRLTFSVNFEDDALGD